MPDPNDVLIKPDFFFPAFQSNKLNRPTADLQEFTSEIEDKWQRSGGGERWCCLSSIHPILFWGQDHTADGLEIRRSPVDMVNVPSFTGFYTCWVVGLGISEASTIWTGPFFKD